MECVCLLLDVPTSWDSAKKVLGDTQFMQKLINYDKDNMDRKIVKKMLKYYDDPEFTPENVQRVSNAAKSLCMWCRAMKVYDDVAQVVEPKRLVLAENKAKLEEMESKLAKVQANLKEVVDKVDALTLALTPTLPLPGPTSYPYPCTPPSLGGRPRNDMQHDGRGAQGVARGGGHHLQAPRARRQAHGRPGRRGRALDGHRGGARGRAITLTLTLTLT